MAESHSRNAGTHGVQQQRRLRRVNFPLPHLRALRERAVLTQEQLGAMSGVSRHTIHMLETSARPAYPTTIQKLAKALKVSPTALIGSDE